MDRLPLIWEAGARPEPFAGTVTIETATTENDHDAPASQPAVINKSSPEGWEPLPQAADSIAVFAPPAAARAEPDVMEDMLAMVALAGLAVPQQGVDTVVSHSPAEGHQAQHQTSSAESRPLPVHLAVSMVPKAQPSGEHFMEWLRQGVTSRRLLINDAKALVHTVSDTVYLVSPGVFQRYAQEHPQLDALAKQEKQQDWQWIQKRFEKLQQHRKQANGLNIWNCVVTGPRKSRRLHGYLLVDPRTLFADIRPNNPYLRLVDE